MQSMDDSKWILTNLKQKKKKNDQTLKSVELYVFLLGTGSWSKFDMNLIHHEDKYWMERFP